MKNTILYPEQFLVKNQELQLYMIALRAPTQIDAGYSFFLYFPLYFFLCIFIPIILLTRRSLRVYFDIDKYLKFLCSLFIISNFYCLKRLQPPDAMFKYRRKICFYKRPCEPYENKNLLLVCVLSRQQWLFWAFSHYL